MSTPAPPAATPTETPPPLQQQAWNLAEPAPQEPVAASEGIREAVAAQSETAGTIVDRLDGWAVMLGTHTISVWDVLIVLFIIAAILIVASIAARIGKASLRRMTRLDNAQQVLAEKLVAILIWGAALFIGIDLLGIDLTALAVFSGAFGLAIGFGLQKTFGNLIAGIILLMDKSIKPGDVIAVADTVGNETFGQIRKIGIRAVSITTRDQREYLIPNENLMINQVENWSYSSRNVRMQVPVGVSYKADLKVAEQLMLEAASKVERILETPPPTVWMTGYGESSVDFTIQCWIMDPEEGVGNVRSAVLKNLWWLFQEHDIEIPFPQRDINIRSGEEVEQLVAALAQRVGGKDKAGLE